MLATKSACRRLVVLLAVLSIAAIGVVTSSASADPVIPPNGIYTCGWIAENPVAAAQAHVTCDPAVFFTAMAAPATQAGVNPDVCPYVPNGYRVGKGVFAWSDYYNTTGFSWYGLYSPSDYTWYIQGLDGLNYVHGNGDGSQGGLMYYTYRWGAQNHSDTAQEWRICVY